jgi:far upstream element-binding protein
MAEDDNDASLKRDRPEGEEEAADENETSERPAKMTKKDEDTKEISEEDKAADDKASESSGVCQGSNCGTDLNSDKGSDVDPPEGDNPAEENAQSSSAVAKEEAKETAKPQAEASENAGPTSEEAKTAETGADAEAAKSSAERVPAVEDKTHAEGNAPETTSATDSGVSGLPPMGAVDPPAQSSVEERAELHKDLVGRVIGKGGEMIRDLQARSGCRVDVDQNVALDAPRIITYRGTRESVDFAKQLVATLCSQDGRDAELPLGMATRKELIVPASSIGKVIGRGGEMIRDLQTRSKSKIQVDHSGSSVVDPNTRLVVVTGTEDAVVKAEEMIMFLVANPTMDASTAIDMLVEDKARGGVWGSGPPYPNLPNQGRGMQGQTGYGYGAGPGGGYPGQPVYQQPYGGGYGGGYGATGVEMEIFHAAKTYMGRIIGQRGVTINDLQKRSGCDIQINQEVPYGQDCEISIKGSRQGIEMAKTMLREIIEMGPNHPYAGGAGGGGGPPIYGAGGGYPQAAYGQVPVQQQAFTYQQPVAQPGAYGGAYAYGAPAYQPAAYGQPEMAYQAQPYGMPQQQQQVYGGYVQQPPMQAPPPHSAAPASLWRTASTAEGQVYYYNEKTGETQWEKPAGM